MAAQSRLPLRSSARHRDRSAGVGELPATVIQRNPLTLRAKKRTLSLSTDHPNGTLAKKPRTSRNSRSSPDNSIHPNAKVLRTYGARHPATPSSTQSLTQVTVGLRKPPIIIVQPTPPQSSHPPTDDGESQSEVHRAQPIDAAATNKVDKRSLRSHDGAFRLKSELASYFADYDEILSNEPREADFLTPKTRIHIIDEPLHTAAPNALEFQPSDNKTPKPFKDQAIQSNGSPQHNRKVHPVDIHDLNHAKRLDFSSEERHTRHIIEDPLSDDIYVKAHRRAERREKQHRNTEKESAQHEKFHLERILDELKGPAWLRTLGVSGVTDSDKKNYEPKRDHFIREVRALLDKFNAWKQEEKRQKSQRERASTVDEDEEEVDEEEEEAAEEEEHGDAGEEEEEDDEYDDDNDNNTSLNTRSKSNPNDPPRIRRPLSSSRPPTVRRNKRQTTALVLAEPTLPEKPFTSFYTKPHLREAAMSAHRRGGRIRTAFGHPLPDPPNRNFDLPREMLTGDVLAARARSRRAAKRDH